MRTVSVDLRLNVAGFVAAARTASGAVGGIGRSVQATAATAAGGMGRAAGAVSGFENTLRTSTGRQREALDRVGRGATMMAVGLVGGFALAVKSAMDFEKQMSATGAAAEANASQLKQLSAAAMDAGRNTAFSAIAAAKGEEELVKAGVSVRDVLGGGLKGALDLASAGQIAVGDSAEIAATAMTQFGLSGKDIPHVADLLAAGANKAQGEVKDLGFAMKMGGLVGAQFGLTVDQTVGTLAAFASAGLVGSDSGTSFKTMLLHLAAPTKKAQGLMQDLGIETYDAGGKFIGITGLADQLKNKLGGLSEAQRNQALATIFGTDAIRGANILYRQGGAGIQDWINKTNDSGYAAKVAGEKLNNLSGDLTKLKGSLTTALIGAGEGAQGPLRDLTQNVTGVVNAFISMPSSAQTATIWIMGVSGAALLAAKGIIFFTTTVKDTKIALETMGLTSARVGAAMTGLRTALSSTAGFLAGPWGVAIAAAVGVIALFSATKNRAAKATAEFTAAIKADSGALGENTRAAVANKLEQLGVAKAATDAGLSLPQVTDAVLGNKGALEQVNSQLDAYEQKLRSQISTGGKSRTEVLAQIYQIEQLRKSIGGQNSSLQASAASAKRVADATANTTGAQTQATTAAVIQAAAESDLSKAMNDAAQTAENLKAALDALAKGNMDADRAAIAQRKSALDAAKAADHRAGLTDKEKTALLDLADADQKQLVAMKANGATGEELASKQKRLADQFIKTAMASGISRAAATELAKRYAVLGPVTNAVSDSMTGYINQVTIAATAQRGLDMRTGSATEAQRLYADRISNNLPVLYALAGSNQAAKAQVDALARSSGNVAGVQLITRSAFLKNAAAMGIATGKAQDLWAAFKKIQSRQIKLTVLASGSWQMAGAKGALLGAGAAGLAKGGPVPVLGPESSRAHDSVPAMLRVDEHVWTPEEVDAVGGHAAMYRIRRAALAGKVKGYAAGGQVALTGGGSSSAATAAVLKPIETGYGQLISAIGKTFAAAWKKFAGSAGGVVQAARSQIGLPYSWGGGGTGGPSYGIGRGAGTYGYDCSGLTEFAWWKGRHKDIGGVTDSQWANSTPISGPRPGALAFPSGPSVHVMLGSNRPGYVIQAPHTGAFVEEVPRSSGNWRWPTGMAAGGEVKLGERVTSGRAGSDDALLAKVLQIAGSGPRGSERHTAQIARAGDMRLWAEPETGGEAYIPLASSKRSRSKAILASVAGLFGMSVKGMANGGITSFASGSTPLPDLNLGDYLTKYTGTTNPATKADVTTAQKARLTQLDQLRNAEDALAKARKAHHKDWAAIRRDERRVAAERRDVAAATAKLADVEARYKKAQASPATQLGAALGLGIKNTGAFIGNLTKLADRGFGALAQQLLAMGGPEAEKIAADAAKFSSSKLGKLEGQIKTAQQQQAMLTNLPNVLAVRSALKGGKGGTWIGLLDATGLDPGTLATAVHLIAKDLGKTASGKALLADMKAHGYAAGGWISGVPGVDANLIGATSGEFMVRAGQARKYGPLVEAINADRVGDALLRRYASSSQFGAGQVRGGDGGSAPVINQTFNHQPMDAAQLARESAREAAWMLSA